MHWVYVLKSSTTGNIYVGETTRLFRRWNEHRTGRGGVNTSKDDYDTLIGLYNIGNNTSFIEHKHELEEGKFNYKCWYFWGKDECKQDALIVENLITEQHIFENREAIGKVRGGKYTTQERCIDFYCKNLEHDKYLSFQQRRPLCHCGYPCEVNMKKDNTKIYFNCPLAKPDKWNETGFFTGLNLETKCDFYKEFEAYGIAKEKYETNRRERCRKQSEWWVKNLPTNEDECIKCKSDEFEPFFNQWHENFSVCEDCFHNHYEDLKREYMDKRRDVGYIFE